MRVYKKRRHWWCWGHDAEGERWWASTGILVEDDPKGTAALRKAKQIDRARFLRDGRPPALPLIDALEELRLAKVRRGASEATMGILRDKGRRLLAHFGPAFDCAGVALRDTERYLDARRADGVSDHTISKELNTLTAALRVSAKHGRWSGDVAMLRPDALTDVYTPRDRWLTVDEYVRLRAEAYPGRREHLDAYVYLGVRQSELFRVEAEHVDHGRRAVFVDGTKTKAAKRWVPVAPALWPVIERRAAEADVGPLFDPWLRQNMRQSLHRWCEKAGIEPVSANDLRRTFASWLCSAGVAEMTCARLMGHTSSAMVRRVYAQLSAEALRTAIDRLPVVTHGSQQPPATNETGETNEGENGE